MGFTHNGHPVACAAALANLDIIEYEDLLGRATTTGAYLLERHANWRRCRSSARSAASG